MKYKTIVTSNVNIFTVIFIEWINLFTLNNSESIKMLTAFGVTVALYFIKMLSGCRNLSTILSRKLDEQIQKTWNNR